MQNSSETEAIEAQLQPASLSGGYDSAASESSSELTSKSADICPICLAPLKNELEPISGSNSQTLAVVAPLPAVGLSCGHIFHLACVAQHFARANNRACPMCRSEIDDNERAYIATVGENNRTVLIPECVEAHCGASRRGLVCCCLLFFAAVTGLFIARVFHIIG